MCWKFNVYTNQKKKNIRFLGRKGKEDMGIPKVFSTKMEITNFYRFRRHKTLGILIF